MDYRVFNVQYVIIFTCAVFLVLLTGFEPWVVESWVRRSTNLATPSPQALSCYMFQLFSNKSCLVHGKCCHASFMENADCHACSEKAWCKRNEWFVTCCSDTDHIMPNAGKRIVCNQLVASVANRLTPTPPSPTLLQFAERARKGEGRGRGEDATITLFDLIFDIDISDPVYLSYL